MKTFYLLKSFLPFTFLPLAPGVVQVELVRQGILSYGSGAIVTVLLQVAFTLGLIIWFAQKAHQKHEAKAYLKMSCVSKKVFYQGQWMTVEKYLAEHHNIVVSHGMTPEESQAWIRDSEEWLREAKEVGAFETSSLPVVKERQVAMAK